MLYTFRLIDAFEVRPSLHLYNRYALFYCLDVIFSKANDLVDLIWLDGSLNNKKTEIILHHIGLKYEMILVDWISHEIIDLTNTNEIKQFIID